MRDQIRRLKEDIQRFLQNKVFLILLLLTAVGCYGFKVMHLTIGIDDTPYAYYFSDGLAVVVGRWVMYLLNRFLNIGDFAPFLTDFAGVLLLIVAAVLWSVVFYRIFRDSIPVWGYLVFACLFLSNPLISEVYTYFLHNGIATGYVCSAIAILGFQELLERQRMKDRVGPFLLAAVGCWVAVGCYESFAVVFLVAAVLVLIARRICGKKDKPVRSVLFAGAVLVAVIVLRSLMVNLLIQVFSLQHLQEDGVRRSLTEMLGWIGDPKLRAEFTMALKRLFVMYGVFAYHYLPIWMYVVACMIFGLYSLWCCLRRKDLWIPVYMVGAFVASWILILVEGKVTLYRACQFLPLFSAFAFLLLIYAGRKLWEKPTQDMTVWKKRVRTLAVGACMAIAFVAVWNQTADMNKWFYVDYKKYEDAKKTAGDIALELEKNYNTSKPLVFIGDYYVPMEIIQDAYVPIGSETFYKMNRITSMIDEHLLEKFYRRNNIWVAQTPSLSVLSWGITAFDGNQELIQFLKMHGHSFVATEGEDFIHQVMMDNLDMPAWPKQGSIREEEEYIIINFGF